MGFLYWRAAGTVGIAVLAILSGDAFGQDRENAATVPVPGGELAPVSRAAGETASPAPGQNVVPTAVPAPASTAASTSAPASSWAPPPPPPAQIEAGNGAVRGPQVPKMLDLSEAVALTLARHPEIARANAALARGRADLGAARSAWYPQVGYQANLGPNMLTGRNDSALNQNMAGPSLYLQQQVWDFGRSKGEIGAARSTTAQREWELESVADQLAEQSALTFLDVKRYELLSLAATRQVEELEHLRYLIGLRVDAGVSDRSDLMLADVRVESAKGEAIQAQTSLQVAQSALLNLIGGIPENYADPEAVISRFETGEDEPDYETLPAVIAANEAENAAASKIGQAKAERYPQLGLQAGYTRNNYTYNSRDNAFTAMVTVTGNLYRRGTHYQIEAAQEDRRAAEATKDVAILDARGRALSARQEIRAGRARITAYARQEEQAITAARIFFEEYKLGKRTLTELLNTQLETYRAASARITAEYDIMAARVRFENVCGTLRPSLGLPARLIEEENPNG